MADFNRPGSYSDLSEGEREELKRVKEQYFHKISDIMNTQDFDHSQIFPPTQNLSQLLSQLVELRKCLMSFRPLNAAQVANLTHAFDTEYTYESNRIEGNTLTLMETELVISKGMTIDGKPMKDHMEAVNHQQAIDYIRELVTGKQELDQKALLDIHALVLQGIDRRNAGRYRVDPVRIGGSRHICPNPLKVPQLMDEYFAFYEANKNSMHPVELAAEMHERLVTIHPFIDGNGRTARLVMNLILLQTGYPITVISSDKKRRARYYTTLEAAQISDPRDNTEFKVLIAETAKEWCIRYLNMLAPSIGNESKDKGYYYFKKIEPYLQAEKS